MSHLIHHILLATSPASCAIHSSDHVPVDLPRMPCTLSTRQSHSRSYTDTGPLPMPFLVHHLACTMPRTCIHSMDVNSARIPSTIGIQLCVSLLSNPASTARPVL
jgi:hypothetical protein